MKKCVIISASPRAGGNSEVLAEQFYQGAIEAGNKVEIIRLRDYSLHYCLGCYACAKLGKCFQNDGLNEIAEKMLAADVLVFATPVYFYSMTGQLKVLFDRLVPFYTQFRSDIYMIITQWDSDKAMMENTVEAIRGATKYCYEECPEKGILYGVGLVDKGDAAKHPEFLKEAYEMGRGI